MAQHYIKQLIFSWLCMVHRKIKPGYKQAQNLMFYS